MKGRQYCIYAALLSRASQDLGPTCTIFNGRICILWVDVTQCQQITSIGASGPAIVAGISEYKVLHLDHNS